MSDNECVDARRDVLSVPAVKAAEVSETLTSRPLNAQPLPENFTQVEPDPEPSMTQVKDRDAVSLEHEDSSASEDYLDGLSDEPVSSDDALTPAQNEKGLLDPLMPQRLNARRRPDLPPHLANARIGPHALPADMIIPPDATEEQVENGISAYEALVRAFDPNAGPQPDVISESGASAKSSKMQRRPGTCKTSKYTTRAAGKAV